jgi:hypothetical protein
MIQDITFAPRGQLSKMIDQLLKRMRDEEEMRVGRGRE